MKNNENEFKGTSELFISYVPSKSANFVTFSSKQMIKISDDQAVFLRRFDKDSFFVLS